MKISKTVERNWITVAFTWAILGLIGSVILNEPELGAMFVVLIILSGVHLYTLYRR